jgi:hypothetical protein
MGVTLGHAENIPKNGASTENKKKSVKEEGKVKRSRRSL